MTVSKILGIEEGLLRSAATLRREGLVAELPIGVDRETAATRKWCEMKSEIVLAPTLGPEPRRRRIGRVVLLVGEAMLGIRAASGLLTRGEPAAFSWSYISFGRGWDPFLYNRVVRNQEGVARKKVALICA